MTGTDRRKDLIVLVADKNMEFALRGLLSRNKSLNIRKPSYDIFVHLERDPGCFSRGHNLLRNHQYSYRHALILFDRIGCGQEKLPREELEHQVEERMNQSGWNKRGAAIAIDPELENWFWIESPHVESVLGWEGRSPSLREWLIVERFVEAGSGSKPSNPKKAVEDALKTAKKSRSSSLYLQLAERVTLKGCTDKAFHKFRKTMSEWFPESISP